MLALQGQPGGNPQGHPIPPPPPQSGQDVGLSNVLHFLQTEWRRYERDRNEWEIERAEMRARIALLEGERRSFENVKLDLMRRIKMLEYALRVERSKQLNPAPAAKLPAISSAQKDDNAKEDSSGGSPQSEDAPLPESRVPERPPTRQNSLAGINWGGQSAPLPNLGKPPLGRDPKSRARSRDYLKQCLQEVTYLTSPQAMNPLPNRPLVSNINNPTNTNQANPQPSLALPNIPSFDQMSSGSPFNARPRKEFPSLPNSSSPVPQNPMPQFRRAEGLNPQPIPSSFMGESPSGDESSEAATDAGQLPTAIFRPDDAGEWKEKLRLMHEASVASGNSTSGWGESKQEDPLDDEDMLEEQSETGEEAAKWKAKRTLQSHLDSVRALAFHPTELALATGGDDCSVKIWRMDVSAFASSAPRPTTEVEPQLTLRGHNSAITRLVYSPSKNLLYSASLDSSIRVWALPSRQHSPYAPYDESLRKGELIGHTDAVWDLALAREETALVSCGAEGKVKVWDVTVPPGTLQLTWGYMGLDGAEGDESVAGGATAVEAIKTDLTLVAVAYQNAVVKVFEIETGKEIMKLPSDESYDGTSATQVNRLASHPTMPLLVTGHEDKFIRIFDLTTGQCTHSMLAHLDGVTSLSIDPSGFSLVSGGHDCSVRFWDLLGEGSSGEDRACVQEIPSHREKAQEGVLDLAFHPSLPFMASTGADGVVKIYTSS
ncbi:WD40 repeat-like protein [Flagelloscypha sp. PMI_526]|nr:WD40 repeat-like protein [Flagelloscypha sp. PMI_526]